MDFGEFAESCELTNLAWCNLHLVFQVVDRAEAISHHNIIPYPQRLEKIAQPLVMLDPFRINYRLIHRQAYAQFTLALRKGIEWWLQAPRAAAAHQPERHPAPWV